MSGTPLVPTNILLTLYFKKKKKQPSYHLMHCLLQKQAFDDDITHVLNGVGSDFKEVAAAVCAWDTIIAFEMLRDKLVQYHGFVRGPLQIDAKPITVNCTCYFNQSRQKQPGASQSLYNNSSSPSGLPSRPLEANQVSQ